MFNWKKAIATVAPILGTAVGGPFGGMAAKFITDALGLPQGTDEDEIAAFIEKDPEALVKLKQAEYDFKAKMKDMDIKQDQLVFQDKADARSREVSLKDHTNKVIAGLVIIAWASMNILLFKSGVPDGLPEAVLYRLLGTLDAMVMAVIYYYFGSSHGSSKKNDIIANGN